MKQRARRLEDKAERVAAILKAGRQLWSRGSDFTMTDVAERAGIVKGTIYLYFTTKEELLQAIFERLVDEYFADIDRHLEKRPGRWTAEQVAEVFARALRSGAAADLGRRHRAGPRGAPHRLEKTAALLESRYPVLKRGDGLRFLLRAFALLVGLSNLDLQKEFRDGVTTLLAGSPTARSARRRRR